MSKRYVIDQNPLQPPVPLWTVSRIVRYGSDSVAWFWTKKDAREYAAWKNREKPKRKP